MKKLSTIPNKFMNKSFGRCMILIAAVLFTAQSVYASPKGDLRTPAEVVMIGDSRTEGMYNTVGASDCAWEFKTAMGYAWLTGTAVYEVDDLIGEGTMVIIMLGVNDIGTTSYADSYAAFLNSAASGWTQRGASVYYVSVTQCSAGYHNAFGVDNSHIFSWNERIQTLLSDEVIYLDADALFGTPSAVDGVHYTASEYKELFDIVMELAQEAQQETSPGTDSSRKQDRRRRGVTDWEGLILDLFGDEIEDETETEVELFDIYSFME